MLTIKVPMGDELFDQEKEEFIEPEVLELQLEHSLVSLSKWESIFEKPFLQSGPKTTEEAYAYIYAMILTPGVSQNVVERMTDENLEEIRKYMDAKMTATWFSESGPRNRSSEVITSELIYSWMTILNISKECETWHLTRLFTLIRVCNIKNSKPKKMSRNEAIAQARELNQRRRAELGTTG